MGEQLNAVTPQVGNARRFRVLEAYGFACAYCGAKASAGARLEVDHIFPRSKGGTNDLSNLVASCYECNHGKMARVLIVHPDQRLIPPKVRKVKPIQLKTTRQKALSQKRKPQGYVDFSDRIWRGSCESCGTNSDDDGDFNGNLIDGQCRYCNPKQHAIRARQGPFDLSPIIQSFGSWAVTTFGVECTVRHYPIPYSRLGEDWVGHIREKGWEWKTLEAAIAFAVEQQRRKAIVAAGFQESGLA